MLQSVLTVLILTGSLRGSARTRGGYASAAARFFAHPITFAIGLLAFRWSHGDRSPTCRAPVGSAWTGAHVGPDQGAIASSSRHAVARATISPRPGVRPPPIYRAGRSGLAFSAGPLRVFRVAAPGKCGPVLAVTARLPCRGVGGGAGEPGRGRWSIFAWWCDDRLRCADGGGSLFRALGQPWAGGIAARRINVRPGGGHRCRRNWHYGGGGRRIRPCAPP